MSRKKSKKIAIIVLTMTFLIQYSVSSVKAIDNYLPEDITDSEWINNNLEFNRISENYIEYTSHENGNTLLFKEHINGNSVYSEVYILNGDGSRKFFKNIISNVSENGTIESKEEFSNGKVEKSNLKVEIEETSNIPDERNITEMRSQSRKKYIRTDKRGISLVGKKVSIAVAATAIAIACPGIGTGVAVKIISVAVGAGVQALPNYIYETRKVYRTGGGTSKAYTRFEGKFYLDSSRSQYIGSGTYSQRGFH